MRRPGCTLSFTVATTDSPFLGLTIPHLVRASRHAWAHRMALADVSPVSGEFVRRPPGDAQRLLDLLHALQTQEVLDEVVPVATGSPLVTDAWRGAFRHPLSHPRDYRGSPIVSYLLSFSLCPTRYLAHMDGDMFIHQPPDIESWVERGIRLLEANPDVGAVLPLSGPPHHSGAILTHRPYTRDPRGFYRFSFFTSRIFLVDCAKIEALYPLDPSWPWLTPPGRRLTNLLRRSRGQSTLPCWERMIARAFGKAGLCRADLAGPAWSLHPHARGDEFVRLLPRILADIEAGRFPPGQAGRYNMDFDVWRAWYDTSQAGEIGVARLGEMSE